MPNMASEAQLCLLGERRREEQRFNFYYLDNSNLSLYNK
jgi:hypothetical protein